MGKNLDKIQDPELKEAIKWWAKNTYIEDALEMLGQIEAGGDRTRLVEYAKHEFEFIENGCESLAVKGNHPAILKDYQARNTKEARELTRQREEAMKELGKMRQRPDDNKGGGWSSNFKASDEPGSDRGR